MSDAVPIAIASIIFVALFVATIWNSPLRVRCERALAQTSSDEWLKAHDDKMRESVALEIEKEARTWRATTKFAEIETRCVGLDRAAAVARALKSEATGRSSE